jgi:hypothetical protein
LLLLLGDLLAWLWRLIDQGRRVVVFLTLSDKGEPSAGHIEKGAFALGIGGLLSESNTISRMCPIFSSVWHTQSPNTSKNIPWGVNDAGGYFVPKTKLGHRKIQIRTKGSELGQYLADGRCPNSEGFVLIRISNCPNLMTKKILVVCPVPYGTPVFECGLIAAYR